MTPQCPQCGIDVLDIDIKCGGCGAALGATGAHKMIGQVMLGQYELVDVLGQGGMSVVFKGKHKMTDQEVALKILPPELAAHSQVKSRFLEEAKALAALDHRNIVHLYNFGQENGFFVLAMQFVQGQTWERMILEAKRLDWRTSCKIACDVLRALEYAHGRGVVHRDMKPSNVLVRKEDGAATVMDFGIAKMTTSTRLTATGQTMGTVRYMSPEQVRGQEVDLKTDIYSLGATLFESLTGDTPFDGNTHFEIMTKHLSEAPKRPSSLGIQVPPKVEDALMRCLAKKADDRFPNAREMRKILEQALREADPGLVDTQKVDSDVLSELRATPKDGRNRLATPLPPSREAPTSRRVATASDLADQLEGATGAAPARTRSIWPWLALGALIVSGGAVAALLLLRGNTPPKKVGPFADLSLGDPTPIDNVVVITDGTIQAKEVAGAYRAELENAQQRVDLGLANRKLQTGRLPAIAEIYALPPGALCIKNAYGQDNFIPDSCQTKTHAFSPGWRDSPLQPRIYLVSTKYKEAMAAAVADAMCSLQPDVSDRSKLICDLLTGVEPPEPRR
jgi:serine/threonine protein kinase